MAWFAEAATVLWVVRVEVEFYEFASATWVVVCDGAECLVAVGADRVAGEDVASELLVSGAGVAALGGCTSAPVCLAGVGWAASAWSVEEFGASVDVADLH